MTLQHLPTYAYKLIYVLKVDTFLLKRYTRLHLFIYKVVRKILGINNKYT